MIAMRLANAKTAQPRISRNRFALKAVLASSDETRGGSDENFFIAKNHDSESAQLEFCGDDRVQRH
jgi:phage replication-related protein YjqB (UPF0714/DUF867 family)